ncbi:GNAT family N-acetyltransferase [Nonlabens sp. Ci31]|jgi:GNAT superfamily N-acetyltransferase|uniref:GNAT family N-acetyltransferase n=1 Tax=Nonlabens sp. Ci31 TaxID=2608253 RepID=UPI0014633740|nr:GNAT family N-acetyltransferase [Nonlabens sp. Ci31]QJP33888.1 GNAT family N-acetyltransferase [Nonlabens sp. Ci31]
MLQLKRTTSKSPDFQKLVKQLDAYLAVTDGDEHDFYNQFNKIEGLNYVVVAYLDEKAAGCGAIRAFDKETMEVKRMFTLNEARGKGIASKILLELEQWTAQLSYKKCVLETGTRQLEAIALYERNGYELIGCYGPYLKVENSKCFGKEL